MGRCVALCNAALPGLADRAKVSVEECGKALKVLSSPDKWSRSTEFQGKRVELIEGGWKLLNHAKYRAKLSAEERAQYKAEKQREYRLKDRPLAGERRALKAENDGNTDLADKIAAGEA
jgi:hypothetical protein